MTKMRTLGGTLLAAALLTAPLLSTAGCVKSKGGPSAEDKDKVKAFILDAPPADMKKLDVNFENKVHLIGYKVEPETAKPGQDVKITYYWKVDEKLDDGWLLFTHVQDEVSQKTDNMDWVGPLREQRNNKQVMGPDQWQPGKVYADEQVYRVQDWTEGPELVFMTGIWKGDSRLRVVSGPNDGDNRAIIARVKTGLTAKAAEKKDGLPSLMVPKLSAGDKIVVDGKPNDKAWLTAPSTGAFVDVMTGKPALDYPVQGNAKMAWDDENLYLLIDVKDGNVAGGFDPKAAKEKDAKGFTAAGQPKLWERHTAEIMIDPDGDGDNVDYYEIQIGPQNLVFKSQFDSYNAPKGGPNGPFGHEDWDPKMKSAVVVHGTLDDDKDKDGGYTVEAAIPWAGLSKAKNHPPKNGDQWRMNFYAMANNGGTAWSPIMGKGNFHKSSQFGRVTWAVPGEAKPQVAGQP